MSSKTGPKPLAAWQGNRRAWSLALRLTVWYTLSSFALLLVATGFLYWALAHNLDREDDEQLAEKMREIYAVLREPPHDEAALRRELEAMGAAHESARVKVRVYDGPASVPVESPGFSSLIPPDLAAPGATGGEKHTMRFTAPNGKSFRIKSDSREQGAYRVDVAMDRTHEEELLAGYRLNLAIVLSVALVLCAVVGYRIARRGIRPVEEIAATARRVHATHFERIPLHGLPGELHTLAETFNGMLDRLQESFARLSRFSADIAHELRTPVNNLRGEIEVTLGKARTPDEYRDTLGSALEECGKLAQLIDSLLFLARAEDPKTQVEREPFDLGRELESLGDFYDAAAHDAGVRLAVEAAGDLPVTLNRPLFQRAIGNLIANALAHTPAGGAVTLSAIRDDSGVTVGVRDTGRGIPSEHLPHIFDRFYRADPARTSGGVGLGLAIVKSIVELHGGTVSAESAADCGTTITLWFPIERRRDHESHESYE